MTTLTPSMLDFANHKPDATEKDIETLCATVQKYGFNSAFVNPIHVSFAKRMMGPTGKVGTVISFPLGQDLKEVKIHAIREAVQAGADELDIVPDHQMIKSNSFAEYEEELRVLTSSAKSMRETVIVKFIIETGLFLPEHFLGDNSEKTTSARGKIVNAVKCIERSGADFVKICSGMGPRGVSVDDVTVVRSVVSPAMKVKGAGGVSTREQALSLIAAGANRLGTSKAPQIISNELSSNNQGRSEE